MLDVESYRDLARLSGERRLRLLEGGDPRLEPREAEALLWLGDHLAERGFDLLSAIAAVANDPVRFACRFAAGDMTKLVTVRPDPLEETATAAIATGEGLGASHAVAPQPSFMGHRNPISAVSAPAGTSREAGS